MRKVEEFLAELYHGKPKACDLARFTAKMKTSSVTVEGDEGSRVTLGDIQSAMAQLKKEVGKHTTRPRPLYVQKCSYERNIRKLNI